MPLDDEENYKDPDEEGGAEELQKCPYCKKEYKNLKSHVERVHPGGASGTTKPKAAAKSSDGATTKKGKSTDELEKALAKKMLGGPAEPEKKVVAKDADTQKAESLLKDNKGKDNKKQTTPGWKKEIIVDNWMTNLHGPEIGVYQQERLMAKNRQFSRNLDLVGAVKEEGKPEGMFGYLTSSWDDIPEKDIGKKRLIIKWFNGKSVGWLGTIEEMVGMSMASSIGADDTLPSFKLLIPKYSFVVNLQKEHTRLPKLGEIFSFSLKNSKTESWDVYTFDEKRGTIGSDWEILLGEDKILGKIDEKKLNIGGKFIISFFDEEAYDDENLFRVVVLFTMMLKFKDEIKNKIKRMADMMKKGQLKLKLAGDEERFMVNPRILRKSIE
jgi:hypothetical protein